VGVHPAAASTAPVEISVHAPAGGAGPVFHTEPQVLGGPWWHTRTRPIRDPGRRAHGLLDARVPGPEGARGSTPQAVGAHAAADGLRPTVRARLAGVAHPTAHIWRHASSHRGAAIQVTDAAGLAEVVGRRAGAHAAAGAEDAFAGRARRAFVGVSAGPDAPAPYAEPRSTLVMSVAGRGHRTGPHLQAKVTPTQVDARLPVGALPARASTLAVEAETGFARPRALAGCAGFTGPRVHTNPGLQPIAGAVSATFGVGLAAGAAPALDAVGVGATPRLTAVYAASRQAQERRVAGVLRMTRGAQGERHLGADVGGVGVDTAGPGRARLASVAHHQAMAVGTVP
jgi:hypothetical protein